MTNDHCIHGKYVGGCGRDIICGWCEDGISLKEFRSIQLFRAQQKRVLRTNMRMLGAMATTPNFLEKWNVLRPRNVRL